MSYFIITFLSFKGKNPKFSYPVVIAFVVFQLFFPLINGGLKYFLQIVIIFSSNFLSRFFEKMIFSVSTFFHFFLNFSIYLNIFSYDATLFHCILPKNSNLFLSENVLYQLLLLLYIFCCSSSWQISSKI